MHAARCCCCGCDPLRWLTMSQKQSADPPSSADELMSLTPTDAAADALSLRHPHTVHTARRVTGVDGRPAGDDDTPLMAPSEQRRRRSDAAV